MNALVRQAHEILDIAAQGSQDVAIVMDGEGSIRMLDPSGWSLPALRTEHGGRFAYKVERRAGVLKVEGWDGARACTLERKLVLPAVPQFLHHALHG